MGFQSFSVILDSQLCFSNSVTVGDGTGWKIARGRFYEWRALEGTATPTKPQTSKCAWWPVGLARCQHSCAPEPRLFVWTICFVFCHSKGLCLNQLRKKRHLRLWMRLTPKHGHVQFCFCVAVNTEPCREYQIWLCGWWSRHHSRFLRKLSRPPLARALLRPLALSGTESAILNRESRESESCDSDFAIPRSL